MKRIILIIGLFTIGLAVNAQSECKPVAPEVVQQTITKVKAQSFDEGKLKLISDLVTEKCITTEQFLNLVKQLSFEEDKIMITKKVYPKLLDPQNIDLVLNTFEFETSKKEVLSFITGLKK